MTCMFVRLFVTPRITYDGHMARLGAHNFPHSRLLALVAVFVKINHRGTLTWPANERAPRGQIRFSRHFFTLTICSFVFKPVVTFMHLYERIVQLFFHWALLFHRDCVCVWRHLRNRVKLCKKQAKHFTESSVGNVNVSIQRFFFEVSSATWVVHNCRPSQRVFVREEVTETRTHGLQLCKEPCL